MTKASPQAVTAVLLVGTREPERAGGDGQTKRGGWYIRRGETLGFLTSLSCFKREKKRRKKEEKNKQKEYNFREEKEKGI